MKFDEKELEIMGETLGNNAIQPLVMPDAKARNFGGTDWFGIEWGLSDITKWRKELEFPDIIPADMSDEDAVADIHRKVDELAMTGRFACRLKDEKPDRAVNLADELYRYNRIKYAELEESKC